MREVISDFISGFFLSQNSGQKMREVISGFLSDFFNAQ